MSVPVSGEPLRLVPITLREANAYVAEHHRHHGPSRGCVLTIGAARGDEICGVVIVGRPVARMLQDGFTAEVTRCCTDGTKNACSMLYAAAWRACRAIGYRRLVTYTLPQEGGTSLRAAGFELIGEAGGGAWGREGRPRVDLHPTQGKLRWGDGGMNSVSGEHHERAVEALRELVALKDGPRDAEYERRKPLAWQAARDVLRDEPQGVRLVDLREVVEWLRLRAITTEWNISVLERRFGSVPE